MPEKEKSEMSLTALSGPRDYRRQNMKIKYTKMTVVGLWVSGFLKKFQQLKKIFFN